MRKVIVVGLSTFLLLWVSAVNCLAIPDILKDESPNNVGETLIDFTKYEELVDASQVYANADTENALREKKLAELDVNNPEEVDPKTLQPAYKVTSEDMKYQHWLVLLNSSANTVKNRRWSYTKRVPVKAPFAGTSTEVPEPRNGEANRAEVGKGEYVLGARIHFPKHHYSNAFAKITPPFEIRAYDQDGRVISRKNTGKFIGVIDNVGKIKKITLDVSGRNFKNGVSLRLKNQFDEVSEYFMGYLYYANWRRLTWENPSYIAHVDQRELFRVPLYPREVPYQKFDSLVVYRPQQELGGDFVVYFRKIDMWFDYAVPPEVLEDLDIDDEDAWGILTERAREARRIETLQLREKIELRRQESQRMGANKVEFKGPVPTTGDATGTTAPAAPTNP